MIFKVFIVWVFISTSFLLLFSLPGPFQFLYSREREQEGKKHRPFDRNNDFLKIVYNSSPSFLSNDAILSISFGTKQR